MKLINPFKKPKKRRARTVKTKPEQIIIGSLIESQQIQGNYLVALARLGFIKPEVLLRESKNIKANAEYLLKMIESEKEGEKHE